MFRRSGQRRFSRSAGHGGREARAVRRYLLALALLGAAGCGDSPAGPRIESFEPVDLSLPWETGSALDHGFDVGALHEAFQAAASVENLRALVVVRNGRLIRQAYFNRTSADTALDVRSVTKTVTAMLVGAASDLGLLDVTDPISQWLPADSLRPAHEGIRVSHLLTMTSGILWSDFDDFGPWVLSGRPVGYVLDLPVVAPPGSAFIYNTGGSHLLAAIVGEAVGGSALDFAEERLFGPLGIVDGHWPVYGDQPVGGAGLALRATDLAKLGQLVLQRGLSGERRVLSEAWMDEAFSEHVRLGVVGGGVLREGGYGYQVWTESADPEAWVMWGYGGQYVWVVPDRNLVVVAASHWQGIGYQRAGAQAVAVAELITERVIPSAR